MVCLAKNLSDNIFKVTFKVVQIIIELLTYEYLFCIACVQTTIIIHILQTGFV